MMCLTKLSCCSSYSCCPCCCSMLLHIRFLTAHTRSKQRKHSSSPAVEQAAGSGAAAWQCPAGITGSTAGCRAAEHCSACCSSSARPQAARPGNKGSSCCCAEQSSHEAQGVLLFACPQGLRADSGHCCANMHAYACVCMHGFEVIESSIEVNIDSDLHQQQ